MQNLVTRFHALLLIITVAITTVAFLRIPEGYAFAAHWQGGSADWLWPRDVTLVVAPALQSALLAAFFLLGRALTPNQFVRSQHILDPALTLTMSVVAASQLGLLLTGIGSDIDMIRFTGFGLGAVLLVLGVVLFGAERHTYAGLRMPWPIESDRAWTFVHRVAGLAASTAGIALAVLAWSDPGIGPLLAAFAAALVIPPALSALVTVLVRGA